MASIKTKFSVGLFVTLGLVGFAIAVLWLGLSHQFEQSHSYVDYFDESVQGLNVDSPVKYRGVAIGRVANITVAPDGSLIQVLMKVDEDRQIKNLVAQLKSVGITGIMYVELEHVRAGETERSPKISFEAPFPVVPTRPSGIKKFVETMEDIMSRLNAIDITGLLDSIQKTVTRIDNTVAELELGKISGDIRAVLTNANRVLDANRWDPIIASVQHSGQTIEDITTNTKLAIERLNEVIAQTEKRIADIHSESIQTMDNGEILLKDGSRVIRELDVTLANLKRHVEVILQNTEKTSENVNLMTDYASDQPSRLFFGDPPDERPLEKDTF
jgi:phospholipid/cholesterol/gamma-HCH transport system substrate-binding protein